MEIEDDLLYGGVKEVNGAIVNMMLNLGDYDKCDAEWLPPKEQRKLKARKKGRHIMDMG